MDASMRQSNTYSRATLKYVKSERRNVTLSLPEPLLRRFRVYAAKRNQSMTALMTFAIQRELETEGDEAREKAKRRLIQRMEKGLDLGTGGKITWKREDLYDRDRGDS